LVTQPVEHCVRRFANGDCAKWAPGQSVFEKYERVDSPPPPRNEPPYGLFILIVVVGVSIATRRSWLPIFWRNSKGIAGAILILGSGLLVDDFASDYSSHEGAMAGAMMCMGGFLLWQRK
jgi:hypothetical protein